MSISFLVERTSTSIMNNLGRMFDQKIRNAAELRYCIGDPILSSICDAWHYKAKLEESVKDHTNNESLQQLPLFSRTPAGLNFHRKVTDLSGADYTVYCVRNTTGDIISVMIEAKHTSYS